MNVIEKHSPDAKNGGGGQFVLPAEVFESIEISWEKSAVMEFRDESIENHPRIPQKEILPTHEIIIGSWVW